MSKVGDELIAALEEALAIAKGEKAAAAAHYRPCPFCGSTNIFPIARMEGRRGYFSLCNNCKSQGPLSPSPEMAGFRWSSRSKQP